MGQAWRSGGGLLGKVPALQVSCLVPADWRQRKAQCQGFYFFKTWRHFLLLSDQFLLKMLGPLKKYRVVLRYQVGVSYTGRGLWLETSVLVKRHGWNSGLECSSLDSWSSAGRG